MKGWMMIAGVVVSYDAWAAARRQPTLSANFRGATEAHPVVIGIGTAYLVIHLWGRWPRKVDPFCGFVWLVARVAS